MPASFLGRRRPRPVAGAPAPAGAAVAKAWLVELVAIAPLEHATRLPGPRFADDAPRLCAAVVAALAADAAFDDLEPGGSLAPLAAGAGHLADAPTPLEAVTALEALRAVVWSALREELDRPEPGLVAELADRLSAVITALTTAVLDASAAVEPSHAGDRGPLAAVLRRDHGGVEVPEVAVLRRDHGGVEVPEEGEEEPVAEAPPEHDSPLRDLEAALRDAAGAEDPLGRLRELAQTVGRAEPAADPDPFSAAATRLREGARPVVEDATDFRAARIAPWIAAIDRRLARHRHDGLPFGVLCVELTDLDRLAAAVENEELMRALDGAEEAVCAQLRPADALVRERPGRYWLTAPDTDPADARELAHRIAAAIAAAPPHRGAPLEAAVGLATCPADAIDAASLEGRAEEGLFAARAAGLRVAAPPL